MSKMVADHEFNSRSRHKHSKIKDSEKFNTMRKKIKIKEEKSRVSINEYTAIIQKTPDGWYIGQCEQVPGALTQGITIDEVKENLKDAIELVLETERDICKKRSKGGKELKTATIPRDIEIDDILCNKICKQLGIPEIK